MGAALLIPLLGQLIPAAILGAQKLFGSLTGSAKAANDAAKLKTVTDALTPFIQALATAGKIPGSPIPADVEAAIEAVLSGMKLVGAVPSAPVANAVLPAAGANGVTAGITYKIIGTMQVTQ